jgi:hypothetical protein
MFKIHWEGFPDSEDSWEPRYNLRDENFDDLEVLAFYCQDKMG